jgi:hypothetical protein
MQPDQKSVGRNRVEKTSVVYIRTKAKNKREASRNHYAVIHCRPVSQNKREVPHTSIRKRGVSDVFMVLLVYGQPPHLEVLEGQT